MWNVGDQDQVNRIKVWANRSAVAVLQVSISAKAHAATYATRTKFCKQFSWLCSLLTSYTTLEQLAVADFQL